MVGLPASAEGHMQIWHGKEAAGPGQFCSPQQSAAVGSCSHWL